MCKTLNVQTGDPPVDAIALNQSSADSSFQSINDLLLSAIQSNQPASLAYLLTTLPSINFADSVIQTALSTDNIDIFTILLDHDERIINHEFDDGTTPLVIACQGAKQDFAIWLLDRGADPKKEGEVGKGPLWQAVRTRQNVGLIRRLFEACGGREGVDERVKVMAIAVGDLKVLDLFGIRWC